MCVPDVYLVPVPVWELFSTGLEDKDRHRQVQTKKSDKQADSRNSRGRSQAKVSTGLEISSPG